MRIMVLLAVAAVAGAASAQMTGPQAFDEGKAFGATTNTPILPNINASNGAEVLKDFATSAPQSSYWGGAQTPISPALSGGITTIADCDANVGSMTDPAAKQHCEAVNYMNRLPTVKPPPMVTKTDPIYTAGRAIAADPQAIAGAMQGSYSGCTTNTVTGPAQTVDQSCEEYSTTETAKCQIGQIVKVDADHLYKCLETIKAVSDQTCTVGRVVAVTPEYNYQCIQNNYTIETLQCKKIAGVTIGSQTILNCTPPNHFTGGGGWGDIYCRDNSTFRYVASGIHPYCPQVYDVVVSNPYPSGASYSTGWRYCGSKDRYHLYSITCSGQTCSMQKCLQGDKIPDGCWYTTFARPYSYTTPTATVTWDNQCTALEARAL